VKQVAGHRAHPQRSGACSDPPRPRTDRDDSCQPVPPSASRPRCERGFGGQVRGRWFPRRLHCDGVERERRRYSAWRLGRNAHGFLTATRWSSRLGSSGGI